ncbi:MAG: cytochrome c oxidase assembly protein [Nocardioidaceae bacterium]
MDGDGAGGLMGMSGPMWMPQDYPTWTRIFELHPQPVPIVPVLSLLGLVLYLWGVRTLRRRHDRWPWWRTVSWVLGIGITVAVTATGLEGYGMMLFSIHMAQHMVLSMVSPIFLLFGAPFTLALRALPARGRGSGVRRQLVALLGSRFFRIMGGPAVRWFLFLTGLYVIYFTPVFDWLMQSVWGHNVMLVHFLWTGLLFFGPLVRADPWPASPNPAYRLLETFLSMPAHSFFGIAVMSADHVIVRFFTDPPMDWHIDVLHDQFLGGGIAWVFAEVPTMFLMIALLQQWFTSDAREARRYDRHADRDDDAELRAYNAWLGEIAEADERAGR